MKYFTLGITDNLDILGKYPQIEKESDYNLSANNSHWNVSWAKSPNFEPFYKIKIYDDAKATSLLSSLSGFYGLTVSVELKHLLTKFNLPEHHFYPIQVSHQNKNLEYYWFHFVNSFLDYIDFNNTTFESFRKSPFLILDEINVTSVKELHNEEEKLNFEKAIRLKKITLKDSFPNYDVISLRNIAPIFLVSEKLKLALEESELNGFVFTEYKQLKIAKY